MEGNPRPIKRVTAFYLSIKRKLGKPGQDEIIEGSVVSVLFKLGWPIMVSSLLQTMYNLIDTIWIGRLSGEEGVNSMGAMSLAWPLVFLMISVGMGLGIAALALISQHTGAKNYEEANRDAGQLFFILSVLSIILGAIGFVFAEPLVSLISGGGPIVSYGTQYLQVIFLGLPFMMLFFAFSFIMRAWGDTITPMKLMLVSIVINIILDPLLIFGSGTSLFWGITIPELPVLGTIPHLGIQGAAIATVFSRFVGATIAIYLLFTGKVGIKLKLEYLKPKVEKIKKFFKIGIPATAARIGDSLGFVLLVGLLANLPNKEEVLAAYGIGSRVINITFVFMGGLGMAMSTMVGQTLGAGKDERLEEVTKKGIVIMVIFMTIISIILYLFRYSLIGFFMPGETKVINMGASFLAILAIGGPFFAIFNAVSGILNGSGHTSQQMVISLARLWVLRLPLVYIFAFVLGWLIVGAWWGMVVSNIISAVLAFYLYKIGWWRKRIIEKPSQKAG